MNILATVFDRLRGGPKPRLTYPKHYNEIFRQAQGKKCELKLIHADVEGRYVSLAYQWEAELSYEEADKLDSRARAYIACAIYDAAIVASLFCLPDSPHGIRPSWCIEGKRMITLVNAGFDFSNKTCFMQIGPGIASLKNYDLEKENIINEGLIIGFKYKFYSITI